MIKHGLQNCLIPRHRLWMEHKIMDEILLGKRASIGHLSTIKEVLYKRVMDKRQCGFYVSEIKYEPYFMLFNKKFDKKLKEKIDFRYFIILS